MSKSIFLFDNQIFDATLSASSSVLPVDNAKNPQRSKFWRSAMGGSSFIDVNLAQGIGVEYIALVDLNLSSGASIYVTTFEDMARTIETGMYTFAPTLFVNPDAVASPYGTGAYGVGAYGSNTLQNQIGNKNITIFKFPQMITDVYFRIHFVDMVGDYQQVGLIYLGKGFDFGERANMSYGFEISRIERTVGRESIGGQTYRQPRDSRLQISGTFEKFRDDARTRFLIRQQEFVTSKPFIFSIYPDANNQGLTTTLYGTFQLNPITGKLFNLNDLSFSVVEEL